MSMYCIVLLGAANVHCPEGGGGQTSYFSRGVGGSENIAPPPLGQIPEQLLMEKNGSYILPRSPPLIENTFNIFNAAAQLHSPSLCFLKVQLARPRYSLQCVQILLFPSAMLLRQTCSAVDKP